ncbi:MAG: type IV secretory system conjugative DNA transfer family protein, partial [Streptomycetaceae bacterium]|nr:type IV secretory system conjugative DNA transfer family protein [Streptomycetaceae bacterium]
MSATTKRRGPTPDVWPLVAMSAVGAVLMAVLVLRTSGAPGVAVLTVPWAVAAVAAVVALRRRARPTVDRAARYLSDVRAIDRAANPWAPYIGTGIAMPAGPLIGRTVGGRDVRVSWDQTHLDIWGPRTGKTASRAVPVILSAPGNVVVTSNKRDVVDATRGPRGDHGTVWVFDPQQQVGERASWWWNPLSFIDGSMARADLLAGLFMSVQVRGHQRSDGYFEPAARTLFACLMLAADTENLPITMVLRWLQWPTDDTPVRILHDGGHHLSAESVDGFQGLPSEQRAGVYGTARQIASFLTAPELIEWITPGRDPSRPELRAYDFAARADQTVYLLSDETNWAAAPVTLALTSALAYAHEGVAIDSPHGRLRHPALFVLDEAANICPWPELPSLYSHLGSRNIAMMIILQSWHQGVAAWGDRGMAKLWGSASVRVYGGGVGDVPFLGDLSQASGVFEPPTTSISGPMTAAWWNRVVTRASRSEPVLDAADLAALPRGRAFVQVGGARPVLVRTVPWWEGPHADAVRASI